MQHLEVGCVVRRIYTSLGANGLNRNAVCVVHVRDVVDGVYLCDVKIDSKIIKISNNS